MPDNVSDIQMFYDGYVEQENGRLERHQIERDITWRYLDKYLPSRGKILEIGAATGAYTVPLAKRGYTITAIDLSPRLMEVCKKRVAEEGVEKKVTCLVADARDLTGIEKTDYDAVLLMGPLYHLVVEEDREMALREAFNRLKMEGIIFSTFISRYGIWGDVMKNVPQMIEAQADVQSVIRRGKDSDNPSPEISFRAYFATVSEAKALHQKAGFKTLALAGIEPAGGADEIYNSLQGTRRQLWLDLLFSISTEKSIIGASNHLLYIGVKEK
jgi:2-polyprenyl-3-methyl-5-hydroxy-6-metoxy-1,4-benzoquinol methylase